MPISPAERTQVLAWLDESHAEFVTAIDDVSDAQWTWSSAPQRWSVGEIAEHVVMAEALLFDCVRRALAGPPNAAWAEQTAGKTDLIVRVMAPRLGRAVAPERIVPREGPTRTQIQRRFEKQRIDIVHFARETQSALHEHTLVHPLPVFSTLNAFQWLIYVPLHTIRHRRQIEEVKATPGYPPWPS